MITFRTRAALAAAITAAAVMTACGAKKPGAAAPQNAGTAITAQGAAAPGSAAAGGGNVIAAGSGGGGAAFGEGKEETPAPEGAGGGAGGDRPSPQIRISGGEEKGKAGDRNVVIAESDECRVTVTGYGMDPGDGYEVKLLLENKDAGRDCMFAAERAYLDGVRFDTYFAVTAAPGKSKEAFVRFPAEEMERYGIGEPSDIALYMSAVDPDYYNKEYLGEVCHVYPGGYGQGNPYKYSVKGSDRVLAENENAAVILTGFSQDKEWGCFCADLCLINKTKEALVFSAEDVIVNGEGLYPYFSHTLDGGCTAFTKVMWPNEDMADLEPARAESIKATFIAETEDEGTEKLKQECVLMP